MPNINKNIIMQAGAAVANATNKAAGLSASTPEPGTIISAIQLVNGGRSIGPAALAHFTESVRNKLLSLLVSMEPIQSGSGTPSSDNVRPINGRTGLNIYVSPTPNAADANTYAVDWTTEAGTVYGGALDAVSGVLTVDRVMWEPDNSTSCILSSQTSDVCVFDVSLPRNSLPNAALPSNIISNRFSKTIASGNAGRMVLLSENIYLVIAKSELSSYDQTGARAWFVANPTQFCYELATPLTYQLTGTDIVTLVGDNYIWSDSGDVTITE